jgi:hypothetical protein
MRRTKKLLYLLVFFSFLSSIPWGPMYLPPSQFSNHEFTGTVLYLRTYSETLPHILKLAEETNIKLILSIGNPNPCYYVVREENSSPTYCRFSHPHKIARLNTRKVLKDLQPFFLHRDLIRSYVDKGVIVGFRIFDEPHDRDCRRYGFSRFITISPDDLDEVYRAVLLAFGEKTAVGSTSPPCFIKRTRYGKLCFVQYRWPSRQSIEKFFAPQISEARASGLFIVASLNSNMSEVDNQTFFNAWKKLCEMKPDFVTAWQWPTLSRYPYDGVETRVKDPTVAELLKEISQTCSTSQPAT